MSKVRRLKESIKNTRRINLNNHISKQAQLPSSVRVERERKKDQIGLDIMHSIFHGAYSSGSGA